MGEPQHHRFDVFEGVTRVVARRSRVAHTSSDKGPSRPNKSVTADHSRRPQPRSCRARPPFFHENVEACRFVRHRTASAAPVATSTAVARS